LGYSRNKPKELKIHAFINGDGGWSKIDAAERKAFLGAVCDLVAECARTFAVPSRSKNLIRRRMPPGRSVFCLLDKSAMLHQR
jgi:hypothetical protein